MVGVLTTERGATYTRLDVVNHRDKTSAIRAAASADDADRSPKLLVRIVQEPTECRRGARETAEQGVVGRSIKVECNTRMASATRTDVADKKKEKKKVRKKGGRTAYLDSDGKQTLA